MLIGGPNQSYNVNFKELPLNEGKGFNQAIFKFGRQPFFKIFQKIFKTNGPKMTFKKPPRYRISELFQWWEAERGKSSPCDQAIFSNIFHRIPIRLLISH